MRCLGSTWRGVAGTASSFAVPSRQWLSRSANQAIRCGYLRLSTLLAASCRYPSHGAQTGSLRHRPDSHVRSAFVVVAQATSTRRTPRIGPACTPRRSSGASIVKLWSSVQRIDRRRAHSFLSGRNMWRELRVVPASSCTVIAIKRLHVTERDRSRTARRCSNPRAKAVSVGLQRVAQFAQRRRLAHDKINDALPFTISAMRGRIQRAFGGPVVNRSGTSEFLSLACDCTHGSLRSHAA